MIKIRPRTVVAALALCALSLCGLPGPDAEARPPGPAGTPGHAFDTLDALDAVVTDVPQAKLGLSWHPGCPVPASGLRLVQLNHWGFDGQVHRGELVVRDRAVAPLLQVFGQALQARFPIRQMRVMAEFNGNDEAAMAADNTSAFNCRQVTGDPSEVSQHSYGDAVDINTLENPYVDVNEKVYPPAGAAFLDRSRQEKGMIHRGDAISTAMRAIGWSWGGRWSPPDYQHFSANGRSA
ncbi:M15 family metallopeptidase [Streptomyces sp. NBC_00083]|uniref:M15 family metallopeptidase n=1 Tax=Streptomyces sp. NBC_00083 TaxID=2975647 RepID=UPI00224E6E77|nr:M15 family metallopeptidase [Streptomyces sp. NBC_00083]MCX5384621.1 M15 family metallopeptidase [Streptomyces sp. NBC_00083]